MANSSNLELPAITGTSRRPVSITGKRPIKVESAEEYARNVEGHANPPSAQSLYSGSNYANFAAYLRRPYQPIAVVNSQRATRNATPFATIHDLSLPEEDERRISRFCTVEAFEKMIEEKKKQTRPSLLVFLQGHPSPEWLNTIGYLCNVDPESLLRHLNFQNPPKRKIFYITGFTVHLE
ncbi:uncharacterized protein LY89DRAFT_672680 [Mollisia scopiformis]|uniref:Uncharacterized protein n=1 Tax=Mollisia scopiformis TaxID=149040 RepID=A0A194WZU7_MOLSC|nr:uncharacterized protein LY89DRAFT_672680 [Mollisia scopiformis]KUJ13470.1 hypothetical protein LY89DRAFT_672680 [Mollisia scopiformis]